MKLAEFRRKMRDAKIDLFDDKQFYACYTLEQSFYGTFAVRDYGSFNVRDTTISSLYKSIINGKEKEEHGMFGICRNKKNKEYRMMSLEIFEEVVIDEKLYKEL